MTDRLLRVMVCPPRNAGWDRREKAAVWRELGFLHPPDFESAQGQHEILCSLLAEAEVEVLYLRGTEGLTLDAVYAHDASFSTDAGMILMNPGKRNRVPEANAHAEFFSSCGLPILGRVVVPGVSEAGDLVWLDDRTLLVGRSYRTNAAGLEQLRDLLRPAGVRVLDAPLPHGRGPSTCLHLMSVMSKLDERTILVDLPWLAVETVELLTSRELDFIEIDASERETLASNVLSLGEKRLIAVEENVRTNEKLRKAGFDVRTFPGSELSINGGGGPTCLTRPLLRGYAEG